jgi:hypothetical protein
VAVDGNGAVAVVARPVIVVFELGRKRWVVDLVSPRHASVDAAALRPDAEAERDGGMLEVPHAKAVLEPGHIVDRVVEVLERPACVGASVRHCVVQGQAAMTEISGQN